MHIRKDDQVEVITGDDKGTPAARRIAKVLRVLPDKNKIVVEGVNRVYKHLKPSQRNQQGGRLSKEMPIDVSNVMLFAPVQPGRPDRPSVHRRRSETTLLQEVRRLRWATSDPSSRPPRRPPTKITADSMTGLASRRRAGRKGRTIGNGSPA